ncbi:MAG: tyrosine-type recombinase/integrase [Planctomycetes bacterium]|nr:tyrosine-type recombinase/integrase [Planctomycetota bacterium]
MDRKPGKRQQVSLTFKNDLSFGLSRYRLVDQNGKEISKANEFLDSLAIRGVSERTNRAYGYGLLSFWRWMLQEKLKTASLRESDLLDYIRFQNSSTTDREKPSPRTLNQRLSMIRSFYKWTTGKDFPSSGSLSRNPFGQYHFGQASDFGYLSPCRHKQPAFYMKVPHRVVMALSKEEVADFMRSLRTWRDLSMVGLMLLCGLRSQEVTGLTIENFKLSEGQIRIIGKGNKERVIPLPPQIASLLETYLTVERPKTPTSHLFVCLKGTKRGQAMTLAGVRSLFRYHRKRSGVTKANPHRFRHTFGTEMVRAGISLPVLMHLMGHSNIHTTMVYVEVSPNEVLEEYFRVVNKLRNETLHLRQTSNDH